MGFGIPFAVTTGRDFAGAFEAFGDAPLGEFFVFGRGDDAEAGGGMVLVAIGEVGFGFLEIVGDAKVVAIFL